MTSSPASEHRPFEPHELRRVASLAAALDDALRGNQVLGAAAFHAQLSWIFGRISAGQLTAPIRRAPGGRHFLESNLPGDARIRELYSAFCDAVEGRRRRAADEP